MDPIWYLRLFYIPVANIVIAFLLAAIIKPKRMSGPELSKPMKIVPMISLIGLCVRALFCKRWSLGNGLQGEQNGI